MSEQPPAPSAGCPFVPPKPAERSQLAILGDLLAPASRSILNLIPAKAYSVLMSGWRLAWLPVTLVNAPPTVREVLVECPRLFPKHGYLHTVLSPLIGDGIFKTNGEQWARDRRLVDQAFAQAGLRRAFPVMREACDAMLARLDAAADGRDWDADAAMSHATADIIFRTLLSRPLDERGARKVHDAFAGYQKASQQMLGLTALHLPTFWAARQCRVLGGRIRASFAEFTAARHEAVERGDTDLPDDMLTTLVRARDPQTGARLDGEGLVDQVATLFLAGHETSATTLAWALYLLACQPALQQQVRDEIRTHWQDRAPGFGDTRSLALTHNVFRETLRLYPPIPFYLREPAQATELRGKPVARASMVVVSPWVVHRHQRFWPQPDAFEPRRFQPDSPLAGGKDAYLPFGAGERLCPGAAFATQEGLLLLAEIIRRYRVEPVEGHTPRPVARLTLRSANGIRLRLRRA